MAEEELRLTTPSCRASLKPPVPLHQCIVVLFLPSLKLKRLLQVCVTCALKFSSPSSGCLPQTTGMASEELINLAGWVKVSWWAIQDSILHLHPLLQQVPAPVLRPQPRCTINVAIPISEAVHLAPSALPKLGVTFRFANVTMAEDMPVYRLHWARAEVYFSLFTSAII